MDLAGFKVTPGFDTEAPRLDTLVPVRAHETVVLAEPRAGKEEIRFAAIGFAQRCFGQCPPLRVGPPLPERFSAAIGNAHFSTGDRLAAVERRHPHQRIVLAALEVHGQIGHQCRRAHVHRFWRRQQRRAEQSALDFDQMETRFLQRNADHLELGTAARRGQVAAGNTALVLEEREFAGIVRVVIVKRFLALPDPVALGLLLELHQRPHRGDHLRIVSQALCGEAVRVFRRHGQVGNRQADLDVAQGHRQDTPFLEFENAERTGEFGQRWQRAGFYAQREARGIGQTAPGLVLEIRRQFDPEFGILRKRALERQAGDRTLAIALARLRLRCACAIGPAKTRFGGFPGIHGGRKIDAQVGKRRTRRVGLLALATESRPERLAHRVGEALGAARPGAIECLDPLAPHQSHFCPGRQALAAGDRQHVRRIGATIDRRQHVIADRIRQNARRHPVADAVGFAPDVALDGLALEPATRIDQEGRILFDGTARTRHDRTRPRPRRKEGVTRLAGHWVSVGRFQIGLQPEVATLARLERTVERIGPAFAIAPASLAANPATVDLKRCRRFRSPERHHVGIEDDGCADRPIDLTLRRKLPDEGRLGDTTGPGHQQPGHHPSAQHRR